MSKVKTTLTDVYKDMETVLNVLDNVGFLPDDTEIASNSEARFLIYRLVVNDAVERMSKVLPDLKAIITKMEVTA